MKSARNILITGAAGNLGRAVVRRFSADGNNVIATTLPGEVLKDMPENVRGFSVNLGEESEADSFCDTVIKEYRQIDAALFLVGGFAMGDIKSTTGESLRKMINLNFETAFFLSRRIFMQMMSQEGGGRLVFVGAKAGAEPEVSTRFLAYGLSKSLLFTWAKMLNAEANGKNVVSSVIVPNTIDTPANREQMPSADFSKWVKPEQIADIVEFITSSTAAAVAGSVVKIYNNPS